MSGDTPSAPPGWYPDQGDPNKQRYWDGQAWTGVRDMSVTSGGDGGSAKQDRNQATGALIAKHPWLSVIIALVFIGIIGAAIGGGEEGAGDDSSGGSSSQTEDDEGDKPDPNDPDVVGDDIGAQVVCEDFVERRLKSPSSADFGAEEVEQIRGPIWEVVGEVDSENSFGAMIRNDYVCRVKFKGDDNWQLVKLTGLTN